jgi:polyferredoxin
MGVFNVVMRVISSLIGLLMVAMGTIWILQGLNLAFRVGFMVGQPRWVLFGAILALVGIAQIVWSNTRQSAIADLKPR